MNKLPLLLMFVIALCLTGCRRHYQVIHARPTVDSTDTSANYAADGSVDIPEAVSAPLDEPLIDIPDIPEEVDINNTEARDEYEDYILGRGE